MSIVDTGVELDPDAGLGGELAELVPWSESATSTFDMSAGAEARDLVE
ncbi:hypothetical protein G1H11_17250 [Phytoactinopolyspora alkaliphila]|uniref:Uncharacterized protein n=1 Tax=Phytoactinopolyspora alkaliphila TaxID=1783498 RepID=A0A6N9YPZ5_9ACTN|nr:hypothetical protein [Phytoactinopolyspora alkaliphila]NED97052.1 hypothetical protein [Phytoactinopolyspora alkaliphila]